MPHDHLLLVLMHPAPTHVVPALSASRKRMTPLTLSEVQQMSIEDVVLLVAVQEGIRISQSHPSSKNYGDFALRGNRASMDTCRL
jgi:hypothetical protein